LDILFVISFVKKTIALVKKRPKNIMGQISCPVFPSFKLLADLASLAKEQNVSGFGI
jgi:hypothetical protein